MSLELLSLPNEILLAIFSHFGDPYPLYALSTLCRRLHFLALPLYLSRRGVYDCSPEACNISIRPGNTDVLAALQTALFIGAVQNLSCFFPHPEKDFDRFRRLSAIVDSIDSAKLYLFPTEGPSEKYFNSFIEVLNAVLERSCGTLMIHDVASSVLNVRKSRGRARPPLSVSGAKPGLSPAALGNRSLSTFNLHSELLLETPCRSWTLDVLNSFPLTHISIEAPSVPADTWDTLLSTTEIPTLLHLSVGHCRIKPAQLHLFLSRHPSITTLYLSQKVFVPSPQERLPPNCLPRLTTLSASAPQVAHLLQSADQLPAIHSIDVLGNLSRGDLTSMNASLRSVTSRLAHTDLSLALIVDFGFEPWTSASPLDIEDDSVFMHVNELKLRCQLIAPFNVRLIVHWLVLFPALTTLELENFRHSTFPVASLLSAVKQTATSVEKLVMDGVEHDVNSTAIAETDDQTSAV
ncbi:hypothetical protein B0H10DRAFT_2051397 [Mycena sp. CBHHK59/15]|nr:hypothetical protein B0H10DRAFT_2051397 [Mycena sp. CBHHK59/15]